MEKKEERISRLFVTESDWVGNTKVVLAIGGGRDRREIADVTGKW